LSAALQLYLQVSRPTNTVTEVRVHLPGSVIRVIQHVVRDHTCWRYARGILLR